MTLSIQQAIDAIINAVPGAPFAETVDTVKVGDPSQSLKTAAVTFTASYQVIEQAVRLGANLLITHEPTFYNHFDSSDGLETDPVQSWRVFFPDFCCRVYQRCYHIAAGETHLTSLRDRRCDRNLHARSCYPTICQPRKYCFHIS